jgi:hypothetical protein
MNLESQQKWFHDFWTFTQVTKIPQSLLQKLNYKVFLKSLNPENRFPGRPDRAAHLTPRAARARARGPRDSAHGRGKPARASTLCKRDPRLATNGATNNALFPHSETLHKHPSENSSLQLGGPRRSSARRRGSGRHWPVTPARGRPLPCT